ncbi:hypothetical protein ECG_00596 [Echinococcus granulosus]|nr:hypothetical protein ECG_00596 [Echinococcus granulosus]
MSTLLHFLCCGNGFRPPLQLTCISARVLIGSHELKQSRSLQRTMGASSGSARNLIPFPRGYAEFSRCTCPTYVAEMPAVDF